jgi:hypothetical protein
MAFFNNVTLFSYFFHNAKLAGFKCSTCSSFVNCSTKCVTALLARPYQTKKINDGEKETCGEKTKKIIILCSNLLPLTFLLDSQVNSTIYCKHKA